MKTASKNIVYCNVHWIWEGFEKTHIEINNLNIQRRNSDYY